MCAGLGVGYVLSRSSRRAPGRRHSRDSTAETGSSSDSGPLSAVVDLLHDPPALAACLALALMLSCVALSLLRGGMLAFAGGMAVFAVVMALRSPRPLRLGIGLFMAALVLALGSWFGFDLIKARLATLQQSEAAESRLHIWVRTVPIVADFPCWGTGYGTYQYVERMYRTDASETELTYNRVHNDYLELLVEGGALALVLGLIAIAAVCRLGVRAISRRDDLRTGGLVAGALLGFTTLVLHSIGEFGPHIPAITVLATVMCAESAPWEALPAVPGGAMRPLTITRRQAEVPRPTACAGAAWRRCLERWCAWPWPCC